MERTAYTLKHYATAKDFAQALRDGADYQEREARRLYDVAMARVELTRELSYEIERQLEEKPAASREQEGQ